MISANKRPASEDVLRIFLQEVDICFDRAGIHHVNEEGRKTDAFFAIEQLQPLVPASCRIFDITSDCQGLLRITHQLYMPDNSSPRPAWLSQWMFETPQKIIRPTIVLDTSQDPNERGSAVVNCENVLQGSIELTRRLTPLQLYALGAMAIEIAQRNILPLQR